MFWGMILQPNREYIIDVERSFHLSMAVLHYVFDDDQTVNVLSSLEGVNYLICTLTKGFHCQSQLNLNFQKGSKVTFYCSGKNNVHLTGYLHKPYEEKKPEEDKKIEQIIAIGKENEKEENKKEENEKEEDEKEGRLKRKARFFPKAWRIKRKKCQNDDVEIPKSSKNKGTNNSDSDSKETTDEEEEQEEEVEEEEEGYDEEEKEQYEGEEEEEEDDDDDDEDDDEDDKDDEDNEDDDDDDDDDDDNDDNDDDEDDDCDNEDDSNNEDKDEDCDDEDDDYDKLKSSKKTTDDFENKAKRVKGDNSFEYNPRKKLKKSKDTVEETKKQGKKQHKKTLAKQNFQVKKHKKKLAFVKIIDIKEGTGAIAKEGNVVSVYYVGRLKNGVKYIEERSGKGFQFTVGKNEVVEGLNMGVEGMRVGGKRQIFVPPSLGYGKKGFFPSVPPNRSLMFEVELKYVR